MFATPKRHILAQNREFWRILHRNPSRGLGSSELQEPKKLTPFGVQFGCDICCFRGVIVSPYNYS